MLKTTALHATHKRLGAKMVPFGGWDMPVWYASAREEHLAVRNSAGLFDVSHMGVLDARGPDARAFLDRIGSNDALKLAVGKSNYGYMFDPAGDVIDDIMIYRVEEQRYLIVVNAANNDKDLAWLREQNSRASACELRDLRDPASGEDMRVDLALQGPAALDVLSQLMSADSQDRSPESRVPSMKRAGHSGLGTRDFLSALPYAGVTRATVAGLDVFISRTGYTGERIAYELFVHPDQSVALWDALTAAGAIPCGLAARDSLRTEAGLPLYGHELAGPLNLAPYHIGFDNFVKAQKAAACIGAGAYAERAAKASARLVRFRMNERGVRPSKLGDPVLDKRGRVIGTVTSCAQGTDGLLVGLALIDGAEAPVQETQLGVVSLPERLPEPLKPFAAMGSRALVPDMATVISRFPPKRA